MPDFGSIVKGGWHPEKKGTTFKGQMVRSIPSLSHDNLHCATRCATTQLH
ncbi:hypothetical protein VDGD_03737 [Verticillium dahliae]|nr:hypothetical protein VDGD_03737 [Verticillium dahliae]